jgi:UDP-glucose 4-epimerase
MNGRRVLVTGASGFIGHHLVHRLLDAGAVVAITTRIGNPMRNERLRSMWDRVQVFEADIRNRGALSAARGFNPEVVFHLAAYNHVGQSFTQVEECFDVNAKGTANVVDTFTEAQRILYISTSEVYGDQPTVPFVETMAPQPISPYAITKFAGELYCRLKQRTANCPSLVVIRPFNAFGPYQSSKAIIPEIIINCLLGRPVLATAGRQTREFNYVENLVDGFIKAAAYPGEINQVINLGAAEEISIHDLILKIAQLTETSSKISIGALPYRPTEIWRMYCDSSRARELLGWRPAVGFEQGLRLTVQWFRTYLETCRDADGQLAT